uniref:Golgi associated RAB2 interactor protein-like Rab2B-binding domain-containing protein n=1 Tax=Falco tinnunculus TaxID=100819 RepID=A0A8C4VAW2_FALTI
MHCPLSNSFLGHFFSHAYQNQILTMINQRGEPISVHKRASCVTIGICYTPLGPNPVVISEVSPLALNDEFPFFYRLLPLKFVELSVHSTDKHHLMLKLVNGRSYYLELCAPPDQQRHLFHLWLQLISLLKSPGNTGNTKVSVKCKEICMCHKKAPSANNPSENVNRQMAAAHGTKMLQEVLKRI